MLPRAEVWRVSLSVEEAITVIMSAGMVQPKALNAEPYLQASITTQQSVVTERVDGGSPKNQVVEDGDADQ